MSLIKMLNLEENFRCLYVWSVIFIASELHVCVCVCMYMHISMCVFFTANKYYWP